jgi:DNA repair protein RAD7
MYDASHAPIPGQMENCEICDQRFTVTAYSRAGPDGGLLCLPCTKELDKEERGKKPRKKRMTAKDRRRQLQSNMLDGFVPGTKNLVTLCVETLAKNVDMADDLGDLPTSLMDKLAAILCKKRLMNPTTLNMFLQPERDTVKIYDGAKLSSDDYTRIFQVVPKLKHLRIRNAVQFKDSVMDYLIGSPVTLEHFSIHGANLISGERWDEYLAKKGQFLTSLKVYYTDGHFGDAQLELLPKLCPNLRRLKISHNQQVSDEGLVHLANLTKLEHLTLQIYKTTSDQPYIHILSTIGHQLRTLCLDYVPYLTDGVLVAIHTNCTALSKLRITENETMTDSGFTSLFTAWSNSPLSHLDLRKCRHLDSTIPSSNPDLIGLCSDGFTALMAHSGSALTYLNLHDDRHISTQALEAVFAKDATYPLLQEFDCSFIWGVNDFVVGSMWRCCPVLKRVKVFGNFGVKSVKVPRGRILIGMPNALGMEIEGDD